MNNKFVEELLNTMNIYARIIDNNNIIFSNIPSKYLDKIDFTKEKILLEGECYIIRNEIIEFNGQQLLLEGIQKVFK